MIKRFLLPLCLVFYAVMGHAFAAPTPLDNIVAVVNEDVITALELRRKTDEVLQQLRINGQSLPPRSLLEKDVLQKMIARHLQVQTAEYTGIRVSDDDVNSTLLRLAQSNGMAFEAFKQQVENEGVSFASFRQQVREELTISRLRERDVNRYVQATDKEVARFMVTEREGFFGGNTYHVAHVLIAIPEDASIELREARRAEAEALLQQLNTGKALASVISENAFRAYGKAAVSGGDLGWKPLKELPNIFAEQVVTMKAGETSEVFMSSRGLHILQLVGYKQAQNTYSQQLSFSRLSLQSTVLMDDTQVREALQTYYSQRAAQVDVSDALAREFLQQYPQATFETLLSRDIKKIPESLAAPLMQLDVGEVSEPFQLGDTWSVLVLMAKTEKDVTAQRIRDKARQLILAKKSEEKGQSWLQQLFDDAYIDVRLQ